MIQFFGNWPNQVPAIFERGETVILKDAITKLCSDCNPGALVVSGTGGIGKTTLVVSTLRSTGVGRTLFKSIENVALCFWLNVGQVSMNDTFDDDDFLGYVREILLNSDIVTPNCSASALQSALKDVTGKILFVLDDVFNTGVLRCMSKLGENVRIVALTRNAKKAFYRNSKFHCTTISVEPMPLKSMESMLADFFQLTSKGLNRERQIPRLAKVCLGLPLIASVIHSLFAKLLDPPNIDRRFWAIVRNCEMLASTEAPIDKIPDDDEARMMISTLMMLSPEIEFDSIRKTLYTFLLFPVGQPVISKDLQILWLTDEASGVYERCKESVDANLLTMMTDGFLMHSLLYHAIMGRALKEFNLPAEKELRSRLMNQSLIDSDPEVNQLSWSVAENRPSLISLIYDFGAEDKVLHLSSSNECSVIVRLANNCAEDVLWLRNEGTPVVESQAAEFCCYLSELCLRNGIDIMRCGAKDLFRKTMRNGSKWYQNLFLAAVKYRCLFLIKSSLATFRRPEDLTAIDDSEDDALIICAKNVDRNILKLLLSSGLFNPNHRNNRGETALWHCIAWKNSIDVAADICSCHDDFQIDQADNVLGDTPLHRAVIVGQLETVKYLVDTLKADITLANKANNMNPLELALVLYEQWEIAEYLLTKPVAAMGLQCFQVALQKLATLRNDRLLDQLLRKEQLLRLNSEKLQKKCCKSSDLFEVFYKTVLANDLDQMKQLLSIHTSTNVLLLTNEFGETVLTEAAFRNHSEILQLLLRYPVSSDYLDSKNDGGETALMIASHNGSYDAAKVLFDKGADCCHANNAGLTPLMYACLGNHFTIVELLAPKSSINAQDNTGSTTLMKACYNGYLEIANFLVAHGADPDIKNRDGKTALMLACSENHYAIVEMLLECAGANYDAQASGGWSSLIYCSQNNNDKVARLLLNFGAETELRIDTGDTALIVASQKGFPKLVSLLLEVGANVDAQNQTGQTSIFQASFWGYVEVVQILLQNRANVDIAMKTGATALMAACQQGHVEIVKRLLLGGAKVNAQMTEKQHTPLWLACAFGHAEIAQVLLAHRGDCNKTDHNGTSPIAVACDRNDTEIVISLLQYKPVDYERCLLIAAQKGHVDVVDLLLKAGANVDIEDDGCHTPLLLAAGQGHYDVAKLLLENGANVNFQNSEGITALMVSSLAGHIGLVRLLLEFGADINCKTAHGLTAIEAAIEEQNWEVVDILAQRNITKAAMCHRN